MVMSPSPVTTYLKDNESYIHVDLKESGDDSRRCRFQICDSAEQSRRDQWRRKPRSSSQTRAPLAKVSGHSGSEGSLQLASRWLQNCLVFHGRCGSKQVVNFKPSRLLWVGGDKVSVRHMREMPHRAPYLTLSHRWGSSHVIRLLSRNEDDFHDDIPWGDLPKTFQDAITLTRRLGFEYLWIDSLCIVQDSADDWAREAKQMGKIYQNAVCNIAACDAPDSRHGLFYPRDPCTLQATALPGRKEYLISLGDEQDNGDDHVLYTRAWVLQEALLARRTLDCSREQLFWRCGEMRASEVFPQGAPPSVTDDSHPASKLKHRGTSDDEAEEGGSLILNADILEAQLRRGSAQMLPLLSAASEMSSRHRPVLSLRDDRFRLWADVVAYYTAMNLTVTTDRAAALAGVTDVFRPFLGEHLHGLWRVFLPLELLWTRAPAGGRESSSSSAPPPPRASGLSSVPSWSWMALEGPKTYEGCDLDPERDEVVVTRFLGAEAGAAADDDGVTQLRLATPLLRVGYTRWTLGARRGGPVEMSSIEGEMRPVDATRGTLETLLRGSRPGYGEIYFDCWHEDEDEDDDGEREGSVFCMPIRVQKKAQRGWRSARSMGLVLRAAQNGGDEKFERVGYFVTTPEVTLAPFLKRVGMREVLLV